MSTIKNDFCVKFAIELLDEVGIHVKTDLDKADLKKFYQLRFVIEGFLGLDGFVDSDFVSAVLREYARVND